MIIFSSARWAALLKGKRGKMVMEPNKESDNNKCRISSKSTNVFSSSSVVQDYSGIYGITFLKKHWDKLGPVGSSTIPNEKRKTQSRGNANVGLLQTQAGSNDDSKGAPRDKCGARSAKHQQYMFIKRLW